MSSVENSNTETKKLEIPNDLNTLTVVQLKGILQSRELPVTGTKAVLIKRLETLKEIENATADEEELNDDTTDENKENKETTTTAENKEEKTNTTTPPTASPTQTTENVNTTNVNNEETTTTTTTTTTENKEEEQLQEQQQEEEENNNEDPDLVGELLGSDDNQGNQYSDDEDETTTNENGNGEDTTNENGSSTTTTTSTSTSSATNKKDDLNSANVDSSVIDKAILESEKMTTEKMTSEKKREDSLDKTKIQQSIEEMEESFKKVPSIRISGLNDTISEKELNEALSEHGKVLTVSYEGPKKDVAIVQMENHTAAKEKLTNTKLKNCTLTVTDVELADSLLFVGNLGNDLNRDQLRKMFEKHGDIDRVIIIKNKRTGESKGYGFVDFRTKLQANTAKSSLGSIVYNRRTLRVDWAENCNTMESMHSKTIFVDRLPRSFAEVPALRKLFSSHGKIKDCNVVPNYFGQPRGFAFIDYTTVEEAEKAQRMMNEKDLQGYKIRVNFANPSKPGFSLIKPPSIQQRDQGARGNDITNPNGGYRSGRGRGSMGGPSNQGGYNGIGRNSGGYRGNQNNYGPPPQQDHHYNGGGGRRGGNMHHMEGGGRGGNMHHQMDRHHYQQQPHPNQLPPQHHHHSPLPLPHHQQQSHPNHYQQQPPYGYPGGGNGSMPPQHFNDRSRNQNFYPPQHMNPAIVNGGGSGSPNHHGIPPNLSPSGVINGINNGGGAANSKALAQYKQQIHLMEQKIKTQQEALERVAAQQQQAAQQQKQREAAIIKQQQAAAQQQAAQIAAQQQQATQERLRKQQYEAMQQQQQQLAAQQLAAQKQAAQVQQMQKYYNQMNNSNAAGKQTNVTNSLATTPTIPGATNAAQQNSATSLNYQNWQQYYTPEQAAAWAYYAQANPHLYPGYSQQDISAYYASFQQQQGATTEQQQQVGQKRQYDNTGMYNQQSTSTSTYNTHNTHNNNNNNNMGGHQNHDNKRNRH